MDVQQVTRWEAALFIIGVAHVLLYALLVPPWYHYDEPASLEYALLIRDLGRLPSYDGQLPALRATISESMAATALFAGQRAVDQPDGAAISIGFNQRTHPPLYYALIALATLPARTAAIEIQLLIARLASVALTAGCLYLAVRALRLLLPQAESRLFTLATLVLLPPFADIMSAVNSDVLANTVAVALLWWASRLLCAPSPALVMAGLPLLSLALATKRSAALAAGALLLVVVWLRAGARVRRVVLGCALLAALALSAGGVALPRRHVGWVSVPPDAAALVESPDARSGRMLFALERPIAGPGPTLAQELTAAAQHNAGGRILTLSGWVRADRAGALAMSPVLQVGRQLHFDTVVVGATWTPVSVSAYVPPGTSYLAVRLHGPFAPGVIQYDDLTLVFDSAPATASTDGRFEPELLPATEPPNLLRNAGAEWLVPDLAGVMPRPIAALLHRPTVEQAFGRLFDPAWQLAVYPRQLLALFVGFWGAFSWGEVQVPTGWLVSIGLLISAALLGVLRHSWQIGRGAASTPLRAPPLWWLCLALALLAWIIAVGRVLMQPVPGLLILGFGRYTYPAVIPSLVVFCVGLTQLVPAKLRHQGMVGVAAFLGLYAGIVLATVVVPMS